MVAGEELFLPMEGFIDEERARLDKGIEKAERDVNALNKRLSNPRYVDNAPSHIVDETRKKLAEAEQRVSKLKTARQKLEG